MVFVNTKRLILVNFFLHIVITGPISEEDIRNIVRQLDRAELQNLYFTLGIQARDIEHAEMSTGTTNTDLKAISVLRWWKKGKGHSATREAVLKALQNCEYLNATEALKALWGVAGNGIFLAIITDKDIFEY